jgi:hypothetical protein
MHDGPAICQQEVIEVPKCMIVKFSGCIDCYNLKCYNHILKKIISDRFDFVHGMLLRPELMTHELWK